MRAGVTIGSPLPLCFVDNLWSLFVATIICGSKLSLMIVVVSLEVS